MNFDKNRNKIYTATVASSIVASALLLTPVQAESISFKDVSTSSSYYASINQLVELGAISGYPDGTFRPDESLTRGQAAKIIASSFTT